MVLRLSRFGSGFRERVDRVRVFWSAQRGARIAVPRCSRVYIWSAKTRRLSVRVHQNHTLRSTLLTMQGGYGPLSLWRQHRCSSWRQTQCRDGQISSRQQQQQRTSLRQHSTRVYRPGCRPGSVSGPCTVRSPFVSKATDSRNTETGTEDGTQIRQQQQSAAAAQQTTPAALSFVVQSCIGGYMYVLHN